MASSDNPLKQIHDALWTMLEARSDFTALVPAGNRLKYTDAASTGRGEPGEKDSLLPADFPRVAIVPTGTKPFQHADTRSTALTLVFEIRAKTDRRYADELFALWWTIFRAVEDWEDTLSSLTWKDTSFVRRCDPITTQEWLADKEQDGIRGWTTLWSCEVGCWFNASDLVAAS